jgi:hypothetical protein
MRNEELLEECIVALRSGQELSPEAARFLARHPEKRAEIEDLLFVARQASHLPSAELSPQARRRMQARLAERLGFEASVLDSAHKSTPTLDDEADIHNRARAKKPLLSVGRLSLSRLRYSPPVKVSPFADASIREVFRDLTPDDIRRYIGVRGEDYLHYRRGLPGWRPVFTFLAAVLRGFKRLEQLVTVGSR